MKAYRSVFVAGVMSIVLSSGAHAACVQGSNVFSLVGLDSSGGTVFAGVSDSNGACGCTNFRFSPANTDVDKALSVLLSAKLSGTPARVDIAEPGNCNSAYRVYLQ